MGDYTNKTRFFSDKKEARIIENRVFTKKCKKARYIEYVL